MPKFAHVRRFLSALLLCLPLTGGMSPGALAQEGRITLGEVLERAAEADPGVQARLWRQKESEARIEEITHREGWEFFLEGEHSIILGDRLEKRDESRGRSLRSEKGHLDEDDWRLRGGLKRSFWGADEERHADIALEQLDQLDRWAQITQSRHEAAFEAAEAYLDIVEARRLMATIEEQIAHALEVSRTFRARAEKGEALQQDVLEVEYDLTLLRQKALRTNARATRQLNFLRRLLDRPDLHGEQLAPAVVPGASELERLHLDTLIAQALQRRPDLQAARDALEAATTFVLQHAKVLPELDVELGIAYRERTRDWTDEYRKDAFADIEYGAELTIPLSIAQRNRARRRRFDAEAEKRRLELQDLHHKVDRSIRRAYEDYQLALSECEVQQARLAQAEEEERVIQMRSERLPELLTTSPQVAVYRARARVLEVLSDGQRAERDRTRALLNLAAETHRLLNGPATPHESSTADGEAYR